MRFIAATLLALVAAVLASPIESIYPRQEVNVEAPAMTDDQGNIIPFNADTVSQPNLDAGL